MTDRQEESLVAPATPPHPVGGTGVSGRATTHPGDTPWIIMIVDDDEDVHKLTPIGVARSSV